MTAQLITATPQYKQVIKNLLQLYIYDFSEYVHCDVEEDGLFSYPHLDNYWTDAHRFAYLIKAGDKHAGFALVKYVETEQRNYFTIAEFFIMKKYRRYGIGKAMVAQLFDAHKGQWHVHQMENNKPAQLFWLKVIDEYTHANFTQHTENGRTIQDFENK